MTIKRHFELFSWLQNQVQRFIPHDVLITAWGDFSQGQLCHDIVSPISGMRTEAFDDKALHPFLSSLFERWDECSRMPYLICTKQGFYQEQLANPMLAATLARMRCGIVHGIKDKRGNHDCLYVFLGAHELSDNRPQDAVRLLLPYIDMAFRQIGLLPGQHHYNTPPPTNNTTILSQPLEGLDLGLSGREAEILHWVGLGKTNPEIGQILDISAFTVKNHLQRIYRKLNVSNRAQAVSKL
jgi:transcriptional regulator EpsA